MTDDNVVYVNINVDKQLMGREYEDKDEAIRYMLDYEFLLEVRTKPNGMREFKIAETY
jgi:hypothetical protein